MNNNKHIEDYKRKKLTSLKKQIKIHRQKIKEELKVIKQINEEITKIKESFPCT